MPPVGQLRNTGGAATSIGRNRCAIFPPFVPDRFGILNSRVFKIRTSLTNLLGSRPSKTETIFSPEAVIVMNWCLLIDSVCGDAANMLLKAIRTRESRTGLAMGQSEFILSPPVRVWTKTRSASHALLNTRDGHHHFLRGRTTYLGWESLRSGSNPLYPLNSNEFPGSLLAPSGSARRRYRCRLPRNPLGQPL